MKPQMHILEAMLHCPYKAWQLLKQEAPEYTTSNPVVVLAQQIGGKLSPNGPTSLKLLKQAETLLNDTTELLTKNQSPVFYKVPHCTECQFKDNCYKKLRDKDCISLLAGMTPKAMAKYHNKGITTITQLSYLFKPRRRRAPNPQSSYLWQLKALAIREQKTFVIEPPTFPYSPVAIYVDFEGTSDENHIYLIGALIIKDGQPDENFSFWSNNKEQEETNFTNLFNVFHQYPDAPIYHYGSYESKVLRLVAKKWAKSLKQWPAIEKRMVNILAYLRTHVYPPTYGNGLKELGAYLDFHWSDPEADGFLSMAWRKQWKDSGLAKWKEKLICYNLDDCNAFRSCTSLVQAARR